jgi:hypothetical protein
MNPVVHSGTAPPDLASALRQAAAQCETFTVVPLGPDEEGMPKVPLVERYYLLRPKDNLSHDWSAASGLGTVLGRPSGNLACGDIDDLGLAEFVAGRLLRRGAAAPLMSTTPNGLHLFVIEPDPSPPRLVLAVTYQGKRKRVELLGHGSQVASPPTPGYRWLNANEPAYGPIAEVWHRIAMDLGLFYEEAKPRHFVYRQRSTGLTTGQLRALRRSGR